MIIFEFIEKYKIFEFHNFLKNFQIFSNVFILQTNYTKHKTQCKNHF